MKKLIARKITLALTLSILSNIIIAQEKPAPSSADLAKKLANPIANLISLPFQANLDAGIGRYNGSKLVVNI